MSEITIKDIMKFSLRDQLLLFGNCFIEVKKKK